MVTQLITISPPLPQHFQIRLLHLQGSPEIYFIHLNNPNAEDQTKNIHHGRRKTAASIGTQNSSQHCPEGPGFMVQQRIW